MNKTIKLEDAYGLGIVGNHREYYDDGVENYDNDFTEREGYTYPHKVGCIFLEHANTSTSPVANLGCGTGIVAHHSACKGFEIDGFDQSPGMLR